MKTLKLFAVLALPLLMGCIPVPPQAAAPRYAMPVSASFGRTWNAVVDMFAEKNIQIKTIDRASGIIVAEPSVVSDRDATLADCGSALGITLYPTAATWNVLVRGDSTAATVKTTVRFTNVNSPNPECSSRGVWETAFEDSVKVKAEAKGS